MGLGTRRKMRRVEGVKEDSRATDDKKGNSASGVQGGTAPIYVFFGSHLATPQSQRRTWLTVGQGRSAATRAQCVTHHSRRWGLGSLGDAGTLAAARLWRPTIGRGVGG